IHHSENINDFCDQVAALAIAAGRYYGSFDFVDPDPQVETLSQSVPIRTRHSELYAENRTKTDSLLCDSPLLITLRYPESICAAAHAENRFTLFVSNPNEITVTGKITLSSPLGSIFDCRTFDYCIEAGKATAFPFTVQIDTQEKTERDPLDITVTCNGLSFELSAPLLLQIPWVDTKTGLLSPASGFYKDIPAGDQSYSVDFKLPNNHRSAVACYSKRKFALSVNGKVVIDSLPPEAVPSVHRKSATIVDLNNTANHVTVTFEDGTPDRFFFGVGDLDNWVWYDCLRWKKPQI
ncbi:MAG: hypothetical protein MJ132_05285, partial [Clostridia bacterium]|nr:hypothetical protein [Clostridia bacterium]